MAISTAGTYLMYDVSGTMTELVKIIDYPDMGSTPNKIDTTDLAQLVMKTNILGLQDAPDLTFKANYSKATLSAIKALEGADHDFQLQFGTDGVDGKFDWTGRITVFVTGGGVDEARMMTLTLSADTQIVAS